MTDRQKQLAFALALLGGGAMLDRAAVSALGTAHAAATIEIHRACIFAASAIDGGFGIEVCGRAVVPAQGDDGGELVVEQGCVNVTNADPALSAQVLAAVRASWAAGKGIQLDGGN